MLPHGDFRTISGRQVILACAFGSWNGEAFNLYRQEMEKHIANIEKPFAEILDISQWALGNQDMLDSAKLRNQWAIEQGRCHMAVVYGDKSLIYKITEMNIFSQVNTCSHNQFSSHETIADALAYLKTLGYYTDDLEVKWQQEESQE